MLARCFRTLGLLCFLQTLVMQMAWDDKLMTMHVLVLVLAAIVIILAVVCTSKSRASTSASVCTDGLKRCTALAVSRKDACAYLLSSSLPFSACLLFRLRCQMR